MPKEQKKKLFVWILPIILVAILLIGGSYAFFTLVLNGTKTNVVKAGDLTLRLDDENSVGINQTGQGPVTNQTGLAQEPYTFTLYNDGKTDSEFTIYLDDLDLQAGESRMADTAVKYNLTKGEVNVAAVRLLSKTMTDGRRVLDSGIIPAHGEYEYQLKLWIAEEATVEEASGKAFRGQINIEARQVVERAAPEPNTFASDDWTTIISNVKKGNTDKYHVGDTKTIEMSNGWGAYTLRIANKTTTEACARPDFSETACGFVIEFEGIIARHRMATDANLNKGGWEQCEMREYLNTEVYNALPADLRAGIIKTRAISGYGPRDTANFITEDRLYLFAVGEIYQDIDASIVTERDTAPTATRQLDYYREQGVTTTSYSAASKSERGYTSKHYWWLRTARHDGEWWYTTVNVSGSLAGAGVGDTIAGVSPAFRIG